MFYDRFAALCEERNISLNKAATEIGLSNSTVTKWKKTGATPQGATLNKIANYFNISINYLLEFDNKLRNEIIENEKQIAEIKKQLNFCFDKERKELEDSLKILEEVHEDLLIQLQFSLQTNTKEKAATVSGDDFSERDIEILKKVDLLNPVMQRLLLSCSVLDAEDLERIAGLAESLAKAKAHQ